MYNRSYRYRDPVFSSYGKTSAHTPDKKDEREVKQPVNIAPAKHGLPFSFDKLKNIDTDDYILIFLMFMLIKDNENPDWPLILSLGYILFDIKDE